MSANEDFDLPLAKRAKMEGMPEEEEIDFTKDRVEENYKFTMDKYTDYVTPEEVEKLSEFKVLDEVKSNDEDSNDENSNSSDGQSEGVLEDEIEKMLEEDLPEELKGAPKPKEKVYVTRQKIVLEEKGVNHMEVLPLDWMMVRHYSGMPIYMHRTSRVCTLSKPYFLGKGNTRRHEIPISAIPCLAYRRALEEEEKQKRIDEKIEEQIRNGTWAKKAAKMQANNVDDKNNQLQKKLFNDLSHSKTIQENSACPYKHNEDKAEETNNDERNLKNVNNEDLSASNTIDLGELDNLDSISENVNEVDERNNDNETETDVADPINVDNLNTQPDCESIDSMSMQIDEAEAADSNKTIDEIPDDEGIKESGAPNDTDALMADITVNVEDNGEGIDGDDIPLSRQPVVLPGGIVMPPPRVETVNTSWKTQHLTYQQMNDYCKNLFKFKTVNIIHFKRWADRRKYNKARKTLQCPTLPEGTKLITIPASVSSDGNGGKTAKRDWVMNMNGRSYMSVFHEYARQALHQQPVYEFRQLENASTPYQATVFIGGMQYGVGHGSSKRQAKAAAARASIQILIPEMSEHLDPAPQTDPDFTFFDYVGIEDPRISEFCAATCEPSPHAILRTCLLRNFGGADNHVQISMNKLEYQKIELTMKVGNHSATVVCKNKKTAKQRASQAILQALHPHVRSWGSLLRLYGSRSVKSCKEKKLEEQQITLLQDKARHNQPNHAVLHKLRQEMLKLRERDSALVPVATLLLPPHAAPTHSSSSLTHVRL